MAYIPPWRRHDGSEGFDRDKDLPEARTPASPKYIPDPSIVQAVDIVTHYSPDAKEHARPDRTTGVVCLPRSTLNGSAEHPRELVYILLHQNANPQFYTDGLIYVKSHLHLLDAWRPKHNSNNGVTLEQFLGADGSKSTGDQGQRTDHYTSPADPTKQTGLANESCVKDQFTKSGGTDQINPTEESPLSPAPSKPSHIAVFDQTGRAKNHRKDFDNFRFIGYYTVSSVTFCAPRSDALKDLLARKWTWKDRVTGEEVTHKRDTAKWEESLNHPWAEVKLVKDAEYEESVGLPKIERSRKVSGMGRPSVGPGQEGKSVNELLQEMRMGDAK